MTDPKRAAFTAAVHELAEQLDDMIEDGKVEEFRAAVDYTYDKIDSLTSKMVEEAGAIAKTHGELAFRAVSLALRVPIEKASASFRNEVDAVLVDLKMEVMGDEGDPMDHPLYDMMVELEQAIGEKFKVVEPDPREEMRREAEFEEREKEVRRMAGYDD